MAAFNLQLDRNRLVKLKRKVILFIYLFILFLKQKVILFLPTLCHVAHSN